MTVENDTYSVTVTHYDDNGKPIDGATETFNSQEEAEAYMTKKTDQTTEDTSSASSPIDNNTLTEQDIQERNMQATEADTHEKPASQMSEADAVALNSDVHLAGQPERVVTQGQIDQVETGLHPDAAEGKPLLDNEEAPVQEAAPSEDLHVREPSKQ